MEHTDSNAEEHNTIPNHADYLQDDFYIVALGASAGGLEALERFFKHMPTTSDMAFVVVQHLSPDYKSLMVELLSKHTAMNVIRAEDGVHVAAGTVYLIPPKKNMTIFHGRILLTEQNHGHGLNLPIDLFFRSLAEDIGDRAIGIVLSGTGSDGMRGVRAIKEAGGMVMAQNEESAKFDGMPRSAISTGLVDYILDPEEMPSELLRYIRHPYVSKGDEKDTHLDADEPTMAKVIALLRKQSGVDFTDYKPSTVVRRIERRMSINKVESLEDYLAYMQQSPREVNTLYKELLIGVTNFFRDTDAFDIVAERVIPKIFEDARENTTIRAWVAGCSTGEEAYSLAMLIQEKMDEMKKTFDVKIYATDIDRDAIAFAGAGVYPESIAADLPPERLNHFFLRRGDSYHVTRNLRQMVVFATQNIIKDPPFTRMDLVTCRNLLIYLQPRMQKKVLSLFSFALRPGGHLFLGSSETIGDMTGQFEPVDSKWKIYRNRTAGKPIMGTEVPSLSGGERLRNRMVSYAGVRADNNLVQERLYEFLLEEYVPPGLAVNDDGDVVHVFGDVSPYFRLPAGKLNMSAIKMAHKDIAIILATAIQKAQRDNQEVIYKNLRVSLENEERMVTLRITPLSIRGSSSTLVFIFLETPSPATPMPESVDTIDIEAQVRQRIVDLEQELQYSKENLQATIEELETSNEELQATNEELLASNEELQSTNEELQSVNEELYTVNAEYQNKIQELTELNDDMNNLLNSTRIGTLFLDNDLCVRKFSPGITEQINLLPQDIGRPLEHITHSLRIGDLAEVTRKVLISRDSEEMEVLNENGLCFLMRIVPYHADDKHIKGIVLTLVDITTLRNTQEEVRRLALIVENTEDAIIGKRLDGTITNWNRGAEEMFGYRSEEIVGESIQRLIAPENPSEMRWILDQVARGESIHNHETIRIARDGTRVEVSLTISPIRNDQKQIIGASTIARNITRRNAAEADLERERLLLEKIAYTSPAGITVVDANGTITFANEHAGNILGIPPEEITNRTFNAPAWQITDHEGNPIPDDDLPFCKVLANKLPVMNVTHAIKHPGGQLRHLRIHSAPVLDDNGEVEMVVNSLEDISDQFSASTPKR